MIPSSLDGAVLLGVDYGSSVEQVYSEATCSILGKHRNLDILGHCCIEGGGEFSHVLPSWAPDWTAKETPMPLFKRSVPLGVDHGTFGGGFA